MKQTFITDAFFAGVGGIELGFEQTGCVQVQFANEIDKYARQTYALNHPDVQLDDRDIRQIPAEDVPDADIIMGGFPCQAFSIAGYQKGFADDRGNLFFEMLRIINKKRPRVVFMENVKNLVTHDHGRTFKVIIKALLASDYDVKWKVMNSKVYGNIPQNRERIYIVAFKCKTDFDRFKFPDEIKLARTLHDEVDFATKVDEKYYYRANKQSFYDQLVASMQSHDTLYQWRRKYVRENKSNVSPTLTANMGTGGSNVPLLLTESNEIRKLTPRETFNLQGYPHDFKLPATMADSHLYKQAGNSVTVTVIHRIAEQIVNVMQQSQPKLQKRKQKKYSLIHAEIQNRYEGACYVKKFSNDRDQLEQQKGTDDFISEM